MNNKEDLIVNIVCVILTIIGILGLHLLIKHLPPDFQQRFLDILNYR